MRTNTSKAEKHAAKHAAQTCCSKHGDAAATPPFFLQRLTLPPFLPSSLPPSLLPSLRTSWRATGPAT